MSQNYPTASNIAGNTSPYFGSKQFYFGDDKARPQKRGVDLLQTTENDEDDTFQALNNPAFKA